MAYGCLVETHFETHLPFETWLRVNSGPKTHNHTKYVAGAGRARQLTPSPQVKNPNTKAKAGTKAPATVRPMASMGMYFGIGILRLLQETRHTNQATKIAEGTTTNRSSKKFMVPEVVSLDRIGDYNISGIFERGALAAPVGKGMWPL